MKHSKPPASLGKEGAALWASILREYVMTDAASLAILRGMCEATDRLAECREAIKRDGMVTVGSTGQPRPHPLLQTEAECRRALLAHARALRLDLSGDI